MPFNLTINRRQHDGSLQQVKLVAGLAPGEVPPPGDELFELMFDLELQVNSLMLETPRPPVQLWVEEAA